MLCAENGLSNPNKAVVDLRSNIAMLTLLSGLLLHHPQVRRWLLIWFELPCLAVTAPTFSLKEPFGVRAFSEDTKLQRA